MIQNSLIAGQAYANRSAIAPQPGSGGGGLGGAAADFARSLQASEATALAAMNGGADPQALVEALAQTELAVETAVTIRNRVVDAYQELLRMPI